MKLSRLGPAIQAILIALLGPVFGISYLFIKDATRGPLSCVSGELCIVLRLFNELPVALTICAVVYSVAVIMTIFAVKHKRAHYKLATVIVVFVPVLVFISVYLSRFF